MGIQSADDFVSQNPEEAAAFITDHGGDPDEIDLPPENWHDAEAGLEWVRAMLDHLERKEPSLQDLIEDLNEYRELLSKLAADELRWHFSIDF